MGADKHSQSSQLPPGLLLAPIHPFAATTPLRICVLFRSEADPILGRFVLLRELPGSRVYLGAIADAKGKIQEWLEVWVQTIELRDVTFSSYQEHLSNHVFDQRWAEDCRLQQELLPETTIITGMETTNPNPILIQQTTNETDSLFAAVESIGWSLCRDDAMLASFGLPAYSTSPFRYLHDPAASGAKTFLSTAPDSPDNSHVQRMERLSGAPNVAAIFNPHAGLVRVNRFSPLEAEEYLQILEGRPWKGPDAGSGRLLSGGVYAGLQAWSATPKGLPFLLYSGADPAERLNEVFFLKLSVLLEMFKEVRAFVKAQQLPLLNLSPSSFKISLPETGESFPSLWAARVSLVKPSQAYPLKIRSTEQKYFIRLGKVEPSPFLPEGLGAHSFGTGSVLIRNVSPEAEGTVLEGTLRGEDYLSLEPHDLLWFKLPVSEERLEFFAHVYTSETVGPKEARFRTVPVKLADAATATLKRSAGTVFPRSPYEVWPLLSSPCDMFSLGVISVRMLLTNSQGNLPVILDEVLSLARYLGKDLAAGEPIQAKLNSLLERDQRLLDLISPHALTESTGSPQLARSHIRMELWLDAMELLLKLFPGSGAHSFCKGYGDVSPLALETVFDAPVQTLETLVLRLRTVLVPSLCANEEIAGVILKQLATNRS